MSKRKNIKIKQSILSKNYKQNWLILFYKNSNVHLLKLHVFLSFNYKQKYEKANKIFEGRCTNIVQNTISKLFMMF